MNNQINLRNIYSKKLLKKINNLNEFIDINKNNDLNQLTLKIKKLNYHINLLSNFDNYLIGGSNIAIDTNCKAEENTNIIKNKITNIIEKINENNKKLFIKNQQLNTEIKLLETKIKDLTDNGIELTTLLNSTINIDHLLKNNEIKHL